MNDKAMEAADEISRMSIVDRANGLRDAANRKEFAAIIHPQAPAAERAGRVETRSIDSYEGHD